MSNTIYHIHHIIPKHLGGTDDPSNLIKLTIEEHAEAHRILVADSNRRRTKLERSNKLPKEKKSSISLNP